MGKPNNKFSRTQRHATKNSNERNNQWSMGKLNNKYNTHKENQRTTKRQSQRTIAALGCRTLHTTP